MCPVPRADVQSCSNIEDEYMYDKGLYTINWEAAADSSSVTIINRFWNETGQLLQL